MKLPKFVIETIDGWTWGNGNSSPTRYCWTLKAANGNILAIGDDTYSRRRDALRAINRASRAVAHAQVVVTD